MGALLDENLTQSVNKLGAGDWTVLFYALGIFVLFIGGFLVLRRILLRGTPSLRSQRYIWFVELLGLPALIFGAREILLSSALGARLAGGIELSSWIVLCLGLAWLADRGISVFLLPRSADGSAAEIPRILRSGIRVVLYSIAIVAAFVLIREEGAFGFVVSGSVVLGVLGLALQGILQDAFAGIALSLEETFKLGDWIELEDGTMGKVLDLSWRTTQLRSFEHSVILIPNSRISSTRIHNHTRRDERYGLMLYAHLPNEVDPVIGRRLLLEAILATPGVLPHPVPSVTLEDGGTRPYRYLLYLYCKDFPSKFNVTSAVYENIWRQLRRLGVTASPPASDTWLNRAGPRDVQEEDTTALIRNTPLFQPLNDDERTALGSVAHYRMYPAGAIVFRENEPGHSLFIIVGGQVQVLASGSEAIARLGEGEYFGEMSLLSGTPRAATVKTVTECTLLEIDKAALAPVLEGRPELKKALSDVEARRRLEKKSDVCKVIKNVFVRHVGPIAYEIADEAYEQWLTNGDTHPAAVEDYIELLSKSIVDDKQKRAFSDEAHTAMREALRKRP